jgi:diguanylate cyclase (GGDEF)-like protein/PAS domain S-box-containing protein
MGNTTVQTLEDQDQGLSFRKAAWLRARQIELIYDKSYISVMALVLGALIIASGFWMIEPRPILIPWLTVVLLICACRFGLIYCYYQNTGIDERHQEKWLTWFTLGAFLTGLSWGIGGILLPPANSIIFTIITLLIFCTMIFASVIAHSAIIPTFLALSLPLIVPVTCSLIIKSDPLIVTLATMEIVFFGLMLLYALRSNRAIVKMFELQFDNAELILNLENEKKAIEAHVRERTKELTFSENKFASAFRSSPDAIAIFRKKDGTIIDINTSNEQITGYKRGELLGKSLFELGIWCDPNDRFRLIKALHRDGAVSNMQSDLKVPSGKIKHCEISAETSTINDEQCIVTVTRDVTERYRTIKALRESEEQFKSIFEYAPVGICLIDLEGNILKVNQTICNVLGLPLEELVGKNFMSFSHPDEIEACVENFKKLISGEVKYCCMEKRYRQKDGHYLWGNLNASTIKDENGKPSCLVVQLEDISEARELTEQLTYQASHDSLTNLINRREFENRLKRILESDHLGNKEHALCYLDLDQFKIVNDTCGHTAGDEMLRQLGRLLGTHTRKRDTLARLGGDEFGILMEHCSVNNALRAANSLLEVIKQFQFSWEGQVFNIGASFGLVSITKDSSMVDHMKAADTACYAAKDMGRNRVHVYNEDDAGLVKRQGEMLWVNRINKAFNENRFFLVAQSIQSTRNTDKSGEKLEILLRMEDDTGEIIAPGLFLPAAERYGLAITLDRWVIKTAMNTIVHRKISSSKLSLYSINLSGQSIGEKGFLEYVELIFDTFPEAIEKVCFEITETAAINNFANALEFINTLKKRGCRFALDDFGSGLSSFAYLKNLPVDFIKIDGMFVKDIVNNKINYAMVKSINEIAHTMGKQTIAEFVENDDILARLENIGVDYVQGYAIGKPQSFSRKVKLRSVS